MASTLNRKAWTDLSRRRTRTMLTVGTIAIAIASMGMLALPSLMDRVMNREVERTRLYDVVMPIRDVPLDDAQRDALAQLPNVTAFNARVSFPTRVFIGDRRELVTVWGVDFGAQTLDVVRVTAGTEPAAGSVLTDAQNGKNVDLSVNVGDSVQVLGSDGATHALAVTGTGRSLAFTQAAGGGEGVLYASNETVRVLSGGQGFNYLEFAVADRSTAAVDATVAQVREYLRGVNGGADALSDLPMTRAAGDWPGRDFFNQINSIFMIITVLALVSALFLISNTMNTVVAEQRTEIAMMKAVGGGRRQIAGAFLRAAVLLGAFGAIIGVPLGMLLAALLTRTFASSLFAVNAGLEVSVPTALISILIGMFITVMAALPGLRKGLRTSVAAGLGDRGASTPFGGGMIDRLALHNRFLPRNAKIGVRNVVRQKRRTAATVAQIAVAVATTLGLLGLGLSLTRALNDAYEAQQWDVWLSSEAGARPLDAQAHELVRSVAGSARVEPIVINNVEVDGELYDALGIDSQPMYDYQLSEGRWWSPEEEAARRPVVVLSAAVARAADRHVGDTLQIATAGGPVAVEVIGVDTGQFWNLFFPLTVLQQLTGWNDATNGMLLSTTADDSASIERTAAAVEDTLSSQGYTVHARMLDSMQRDNKSFNDKIIQIIQILGLLIVAIGMIGLINSMTMSIIDRTREIGVLRCLGARSKDIRRMFSTESIAVALLGWMIGVPVGYLLFRGLLHLVLSVLNLDFPPVFPLSTVLLVLAGTLILSYLVVLVPLRRATHLHPGDAIRYQ